MKTGFYTKLAWSGMRKNSRLYTPYILTCTGMVMMFYIISYLAQSEIVAGLRGGATIVSTMGLGCFVIGFFSLIFLFYTNSFLIRRRKKEFGLYSVLGMGKRNIARILVCETLLTAVIALGVGLVLGISLSKLAELCLINVLKEDISFTFTVSPLSVVRTLLLFAAIFFLILLNALRQVQFSNPTELMRSENVGEKPPKANRLVGVLGVILLAGAYFIAVSIEQPVQALIWFFVAVMMVIAATYMIFISGSVVFCRLLQKNKSYYYKPNHFVSVSSMVYRMKRNGAGLASICILATMVLVMISSTTCLYNGIEDSLAARYPNDININLGFYSMEDYYNGTLDETRSLLLEAASECDPALERIQEYRHIGVYGLVSDGVLYYSDSQFSNLSSYLDSDGCSVYFIPLEDYNKLFDTDLRLEEDEAFICPYRTGYSGETFSVSGGPAWRVKEVLDSTIPSPMAAMDTQSALFVVISDLRQLTDIAGEKYEYGAPVFSFGWDMGLDSSLDEDGQVELYETLMSELSVIYDEVYNEADRQTGLRRSWMDNLVSGRSDFYVMYGGLLFLGVLLSIVFMSAAVLIIYYKQLSEGYEDQARFDIMQKVGMTKRDIRKNINSQLLTVFFLPLAFAGLHLAFAFPLIRKVLTLFNIENVDLLIVTTLVSFLVFALFYMVVYRITSGAYYAIVSGARQERQ